MILAESYNQGAQAKHWTPRQRGERGRLSYGAVEHDCAILSTSPGGAQIRLSQKIGIWTTVTLSIPGIGALHCRVVWQRGDVIALQFVQNAHWVNGKFLAAAS